MSFSTASALKQIPPTGNTSVTHEPEVHSFRKVVSSQMVHLDDFKDEMK